MADRAVGVPFAKEGVPFIAVTAGATLMAGWLGWNLLAVGAGFLTLFVSWFFRNPARVIPQVALRMTALRTRFASIRDCSDLIC